jgi:NAD(P)-dependent dehydrogenase (short-subunit alcohol dehydrogenase family)
MGTTTFNFSSEVVLITGGSRGLGLEIAQAFGAAGATVVITARREQWLLPAEQALRSQNIAAHALRCDVTDPSSVQQTVQQTLALCGKIDVLINNAGQVWAAPSVEMPLERWQQVWETNVTGTLLFSQAVGRQMLERQQGTMVNVASLAGLGGAQLQTIGYNASKAAVINLTRSLALEWATSGVRVNCIAPGYFRTRLTEATLDRAEPFIVSSTPMKRIGRSGEVAPTVLFLASDAASYITGQVIAIDGGKSAE